MVTLYILALLATQPGERPPPGVKVCPDGSRILVTDNCPQMPDHRYEFTHEAKARVKTIEWWCRGDRRPSVARIRIVQHQPRDASGRPIIPIKTMELMSLRVKGGVPATSTSQQLTVALASLSEADLDGRCLNRRSGAIQSVLTIRGYRDGRGDPVNIDIELDARGAD